MTGRRKQSLQQKLALVFTVIIACIMLIVLILHVRTINVVRQITYEKMKSQAEYYQQTFETEIQNILHLQLEFFNNRRLPFLANPASGLSRYEEREAALNVQERIRTITEVSELIKAGFVYIPYNDYYISQSTIRRMTDQDRERMEQYLQNYDSSLQFDGEDFYAVRTGETTSIITRNPQFVFVLVFSSRQIEEKLSILNTSESGGVFIYDDKSDIMLESSRTAYVGRMVWEQLEVETEKDFMNIQQVRAGTKDYLVLVGREGKIGTFVQYTEEAPLMRHVTVSWYYVMLSLIGMIGISAVFILYTRKSVHEPLRILVQAFERMKEGNLKEHIYHTNNDEFSYLYQAFNDMGDRLDQMINEVYIQQNLVQKAQLKQLQAQINPHFLYNSFFILSRRIKRQDFESAERMASHLGDYFKYLTRDGADFIPLRQEVEHAVSYAAIQQERFSGRIKVQFGKLPDAYEGVLVPRLILQPLLENSFGHGLEDKMSDGILQVSFQTETGKVLILVEDNGEASEEVIEKMQASLCAAEPKEVTGIINIHRRLQMYFHGNGGLRVTKSGMGGAAITIYIPADEEAIGKDNT